MSGSPHYKGHYPKIFDGSQIDSCKDEARGMFHMIDWKIITPNINSNYSYSIVLHNSNAIIRLQIKKFQIFCSTHVVDFINGN